MCWGPDWHCTGAGRDLILVRLSCRPIVCMLTFHVENMGPNAVFFRRFRLSEAYSHNAPSMRKASNNIALMVVTSILHHSYLLHCLRCRAGPKCRASIADSPTGAARGDCSGSLPSDASTPHSPVPGSAGRGTEWTVQNRLA